MDRKVESPNLFIKLLVMLLVVAGGHVSAQVVSTFAGTNEAGYNGEGRKATEARLDGPMAGVMDNAGNLYIADFNGNRIRKVDAAGIITTIAGNGHNGYAADGTIATQARIAEPSGIAVDNQGNIYFSEHANNCVRKIDSKGIIYTVAGTSNGGYSGNGGAAIKAQLQGPSGLVLDKEGNLYIADCDNNCIRKVNTAGIISLYAGSAFAYGTGTGGYSGDGGKAVLAKMNQPGGIAMDAAGNLFISDCFNYCVRKITRDGIITTIAGNGEGGYSGDNGKANKAQLKYPGGITVDNAGNVYIADNGNYRIRMVNAQGDITTIAGTGNQGFSGDGGMAINASIGKPTFVATGNTGELYFGDNLVSRVRKIAPETKEVITTNAPSHTVDTGHMSARSTSASGSVQ